MEDCSFLVSLRDQLRCSVLAVSSFTCRDILPAPKHMGCNLHGVEYLDLKCAVEVLVFSLFVLDLLLELLCTAGLCCLKFTDVLLTSVHFSSYEGCWLNLS